MSYEGNEISRIKAKIILKNNATTLPTIITQFPKKTPYKYGTKPIKVDSLALITKIAKNNFSFKIKDQKKDTLSITRSSKRRTKFQEPLYFRNCNSAGWFDNSKILTNKILQRFSRPNTMISTRNYFFDFKKEPLEKYTITILQAH
jgi:hypothetical protein